VNELRIAIAGAGQIGRVHQRHIAQRSDCRLVAFVDPAPATRDLGVPLYADLATMLREERPDGVILATPNALHVAGAVECLQAGVPVLVEKPVASTVESALELLHVQQRTGVAALVGHHRRHSAYLQSARALIADGQLGRLVAVNGTTLFHKPDRYFTDGPWRTQPGGGPILINLVHDIDCLRALAGDIVEVQAFASNARRGFAVEDTAAIALRFANGALGTLIVSDSAAAPNSWEQTSGEDPAFARYPGQGCYLVAGDRGTLVLPTMQLFSHAGERSWNVAMDSSVVLPEPTDPLASQLGHFCAIIRGQAEPLVTLADGALSLAATLAVAEAARSGRPVSCNLESR